MNPSTTQLAVSLQRARIAGRAAQSQAPNGSDFNELSHRAELALQTYIASQASLEGDNASLLAHCFRESVDDLMCGRQHAQRNVYASSWEDLRKIDAKALAASADSKAHNHKSYYDVEGHISDASQAVGKAIRAFISERTKSQAAGTGASR